MSNAVPQFSLVLIRRLADGADEWIDVSVPQRMETAPGGSYALIDRGAGYEAPESLTASRAGDDLVVAVGETQVLVLGGFFAVTGAEFYPTTNIAGGAGPFSGAPVTPETEVAAVVDDTQLVWSAEPVDEDAAAAPIAAGSAGGGGGSNTGLILGGLAVGGLGLAAVGGGGGGGGGGAPADTTAPQITSAPEAATLDENSGSGQVVYIATATDASSVRWSLSSAGDAASFSINPTSGAVTLTEDPDFESQSSYSFTVVATDSAGNSSQQTVSLAVTDINETPPVITSGDTAPAIDENSGAGQVVYTATATDDETFSWTLADSDDGSAFTIDASSGAVTLVEDPDFEAQPGYTFTVVATDALGNRALQTVSLAINDLDDTAPVITSGDTAPAIDENSGADQVVYTATAEDAGPVTWQLAAGGDADRFDLDATTGVVTLSDDPDFETQSSYSFTLVATDDVGNSSQQTVSLAITDIDENPPVITSGDTATSIDESSGAGQVIYVGTADDESALTWSLATSDDGAAFSVDASSGAVTLTDNPDFESQASYTFTIVVTDAAGNIDQQTVSLEIIDQDDSAPFIDSGAIADAIDENSGAGQVVYTATAIDDGVVTWSLADSDDASVFAINPLTGQVALLEDPDFEAQSSYSFTVVATDDSGNVSQQGVTLTINDVDENAPVFTSGTTATAIDENVGADQPVYTATADDESSLTWSLTDDDGGAFDINSSSGVVTLTENPDFEIQSSYSFTVRATDALGNFSDQTVTLAINNIDDTAPVFTSGTTATAIDENSGADQPVYTATADDESTLTWSLTDDDGGAFDINSSSGVVTLADNPNFETQSSYSFTVRATDALGNFSDQTVTLAINNIDDTAPVFTSGTTATAIDENIGSDQAVYAATATDASLPLTWSLTDDDGGAFDINSSSGVVTLTDDPDFETQPSYSFTVQATDALGNSSTQTVTLAINDIDDTAPVFTSGTTATAIDENSGPNQPIYIATADDDSALTWSLTDDDDGALGINPNTGVVRLSDNPDFEAQSSYSFTVRATDALGNFSDQTVTLDINDVDEDESDPVFTSSGTATAIDENSGAPQAVYTATATDASLPLIWSLTDDDGGRFTINPNSGVVTLTEDPDFEDPDPYGFTVQATDALGNSSELSVTLPINDVDEEDPVFTSSGTATAIDENSGAPQDVYTAVATDDSAVTYSLTDNDGGRFTINPNSGVVTLTEDPDFEDPDPYGFTVQATDALGNSSELTVTLPINDVVEAESSGASLLLNSDTVDDSIVVFDLVAGVSSDHSGRTFDSDTSYDIYIRVSSDSSTLNTADDSTWGTWSGAANLGSDDKIILVGSGSAIEGPVSAAQLVTQVAVNAGSIAWQTSSAASAGLVSGAGFVRDATDGSSSVNLFDTSLPAESFVGGLTANITTNIYFTDMPPGVLDSQGLV